MATKPIKEKPVKDKSPKEKPKKEILKTTGASSDKTSSNPVKNKSWLKWCLWTSVKLFVIVFFTLVIYLIYLDSKVGKRFEGERWQVPVQVYGKIDTLFLGATLKFPPLKEKLQFTGYKQVIQVTNPGEFSYTPELLTIYRRAFDFGTGIEPASLISANIKNNYINRLYIEEQAVAEVLLEPILIDRLIPENKEDRILVELQHVPEQLIDTLLLVEDRDFYHHFGVSPLGILRALMANIQAGRTVQGGSTLTQQLVKNMFLTRQKTLWRKFNEALIALILETRYSKDQLLEAYINEVYLGQHYANGVYGFGLAAKFYFGKSLQQLNTEQMAMLIGQIKGPSYYDPWRHPERAKKRRDLVLLLMFEQNFITQSEYLSIIDKPLSIRVNRRIKKQKQPAYLQLVKNELNDILSQQKQQSGVKVFTSFDVRLQAQLEKTINEKLPLLEKNKKQKKLQVAMMVTDHETGEINAVVGGRDTEYAGFNRAINAKRPIGSLIKPIIYLAALERDKYQLATPLLDEPLTLLSDDGKEWRPKNYDGKFRGQATLIDSLAHSLNVPTVNLGMDIGLSNVADLMKVLGYNEDIYQQPAMLLGAMNMSPYEINQVFLAIAAQGEKRDSHVINQIVSKNGNVLWAFEPPEQQLISQQSAYLLSYALHKVTKEGTARSLTWRLPNTQIAGKTGTSNDTRDSWFIGFDNRYVITTWLGKDDYKSTSFTGSSGALVLFSDYMKRAGVNNLNLIKPVGIEEIWFSDDLDLGTAFNTRCANSTPYPTNTYQLQKLAPCQQKHEDDKSWFEKLFRD